VSPSLFADTAVFVLALLVGVEVISKVPVALHTPLMSGANAVHGVVLVGAVLVTAAAEDWWAQALGGLACFFAAANALGGFVVTDRMLEMFRARSVPATGTPGVRGPGEVPR